MTYLSPGLARRFVRPLPAHLLLGVLVVALFTSALLLFSAQPMFTKMVLPRLGGSPAVWSVAMVFFQAELLAGYTYAYALTRWLALPMALVVHLFLLAAGYLALPIAIAGGFDRPPIDGEVVWLLHLFVRSLGLPFFALAANGPLLQAWFSRSPHRHAGDPYFLYGASNVGSFAALIAYPLLVEPHLTLSGQAELWRVLYGLLGGLIALSGAGVLASARATLARPEASGPAPSPAHRLAWVLLAFLPAALLVAVTAHLATDVASAPFLWVLPLALFLLTFVMTFRDRPLISQALLLRLQPAVLACLAILFLFSWRADLFVALTLTLGAFALFALLCHGELYRLRPAAPRLTEFYMFMSLGGVLGGAFSALIAPQLFDRIVEYPLLILATFLARPGVVRLPRRLWLIEALPIALLGLLALAPGLLFGFNLPLSYAKLNGLIVALAASLAFLERQHPARAFALFAFAFAFTQVYDAGKVRSVYARSFFGVYRVADVDGGRFRVFFHGTTVHGAERLRSDDGAVLTGTPETATYYYRGGPMSEAVTAARKRNGGGLKRVAVIGLGVGALNCFGEQSEDWQFFEIDPQVVRLAADPALFRSLSDCPSKPQITLGDARLTLADTPGGFDLIVVDAFSSDAVPVHLLTREALALYAAKLAPHGSLIFNASNRNIELTGVIAASAAANNLVTLAKRDNELLDSPTTMRARAEIAAVARSEADTGLAGSAMGWERIPAPTSVRLWTDDYSDLLGAIVRKYRD
jgi:hypothetical protein